MVNISTNEMVPESAEVKGDNLTAALLIIDVQEKLAPAVPAAGEVVSRIAGLIKKARDTGLPILATEQYSRGLGQTLPELRRLLEPAEVIEKIHFAAPRETGFAAAVETRGVRRAAIVGMEAHVCVQQSVLALLERGVAVMVVTDAVASRNDLDRRVALARLARAGATLTDCAALLAAWAVAPAALSPAMESPRMAPR